jgi:cation diffusion facilitator CzcD-associated flavoprotein CzcO
MLKTYRDVHPNASIVMLDKGTSIGGVWAKDRLYPGLRTNNHFQTFVCPIHTFFAEADRLQI